MGQQTLATRQSQLSQGTTASSWAQKRATWQSAGLKFATKNQPPATNHHQVAMRTSLPGPLMPISSPGAPTVLWRKPRSQLPVFSALRSGSEASLAATPPGCQRRRCDNVAGAAHRGPLKVWSPKRLEYRMWPLPSFISLNLATRQPCKIHSQKQTKTNERWPGQYVWSETRQALG